MSGPSLFIQVVLEAPMYSSTPPAVFKVVDSDEEGASATLPYLRKGVPTTNERTSLIASAITSHFKASLELIPARWDLLAKYQAAA